jgi:uncharacterized damage-inducible protein DinB
MIHPEVLAQHLEYSLWATQHVVAFAAKLDEEALALDRGNSFGGILSTLTHIFGADRLWYSRFRGDSLNTLSLPGESLTMQSLATQWPPLLNEFAAWVRSHSPEYLAAPLPWTNLRGEAKSEKRYKLLLHIVNHATYHRGQVVTMVRQAGGDVLSTDLLFYPGM